MAVHEPGEVTVVVRVGGPVGPVGSPGVQMDVGLMHAMRLAKQTTTGTV